MELTLFGGDTVVEDNVQAVQSVEALQIEQVRFLLSLFLSSYMQLIPFHCVYDQMSIYSSYIVGMVRHSRSLLYRRHTHISSGDV